MKLEDEFRQFLEERSVRFENRSPLIFSFPGRDMTVELVPLGQSAILCADGRKYLYEDVWRRSSGIVKSRIMAHLGEFRSVFARKCSVVALDTPQANEFLQRWHTYGAARSKYRYGLMHDGELVAVATFSSGRPMVRERSVMSYEWVRYASLPDMRVVGGMGRLMKAFVEDVHPEEIMSYADLEWSDGAVYRTLGFVRDSLKPPVEFYVDTATFERTSVKKTVSDRAYRAKAPDAGSLVRISNLGSVKYLKRII